jgi:hypothetical protein
VKTSVVLHMTISCTWIILPKKEFELVQLVNYLANASWGLNLTPNYSILTILATPDTPESFKIKVSVHLEKNALGLNPVISISTAAVR